MLKVINQITEKSEHVSRYGGRKAGTDNKKIVHSVIRKLISGQPDVRTVHPYWMSRNKNQNNNTIGRE